jgi:hypothetical protein
MYQKKFESSPAGNPGNVTEVLSRLSRKILLPLAMIAAAPSIAQAQLVSQIQDLDNDCGGAYVNFGNCTAGEISLASVTSIVIQGNPANCVIGEPLMITSATVNYEMNTGTRNDLLMWIGNEEGTDPRADHSATPQSCSVFSLPGPFTTPPTSGSPFGDAEGTDSDQCGDVGGSPTSGSRTFTNVPVTCQDNDNNGIADLNILLSWSQNSGQACGTGTGQSFPTTGAGSKCDYGIVSGGTLPVVEPPILTLVKAVTNNSGGTAVASAFTLTATGPEVITGLTGAAAVTDQVMDEGVYTLSETGPAGYTGTWNCTGGGTFTPPNQITLANATPAQDVTCTVTNNDNPATLTLAKNITNDNGGTSVLADWTLTATGTGATVTGLANSLNVVSQPVPAGNYTLTESGPAGYSASAWSCPGATVNGNVVTLTLGQTVTCTITNNDQPANLTLTKTVINNNGGTADAGDWSLAADAIAFTSGVQQPVNADTYTLSETGGPAGYTAGSWQCTGGSFTPPDQLTLGLGQTASCAIINDDDASGLTLVKSVTNDDGGNDTPGSFALTLAGGTYGGGQNFATGATPTVLAGVDYTLSETPNAGYTLTGISCVDDSDDSVIVEGQAPVLNLELGQNATCTYTNDDDAAALTLVKEVTNDDSGTAEPTDFTLTLQGADGTHDTAQNYATGATPAVVSNVSYTLDEVADPLYANLGVTCVDDDTDAPVSHPVTLQEGQSVTCTLTNDDIAQGNLTVVKSVENDDGGQAVAADFDLHITGDDVDCGQDGSAAYASGDSITPVDGCTYTISETALDGYTQVGDPVCTIDGSPAAHPVLFATGDTIVCTITNTDDGAMLALTKIVTNDNGGTAAVGDWTLDANGPTPQQGAGGFTSIKVSAGDYTLTESAGPAGYTEGDWDCGAASGQLSGNVLTLNNGDDVTCTITNDDIQPQLTLTKIVVNNNGGTALATDWTLNADATAFVSGQAQGINADTYTLSESGPTGYAPTGPWQCTGDGDFTAPDQLVLAVGDVASCAISNDDVAPTLTLVKSVINDDGAIGIPASFTLTLAGTDGTHDTAQPYASGSSPVVVAGVSYTVDEELLEGYTNEGVACVDSGNGNAPLSHPITLTVGQVATCTLTNDDVAPTLTLTKVVINDDGGEAVAGDFTLVLTGADGGTHDSGANYVDGDAPVIKSNVVYTLSETPIDGYAVESIECIDSDSLDPLGAQFTPARAQNIACTVTNDDTVSNTAQFMVTKDFTDDNPGEVQVYIDCNTGLILDQTKTITEEDHVTFVVTDFTPGNLNCTVFEEPVPAGYSESFDAGLDFEDDTPGVGDVFVEEDGCHFEVVEGGDFYCTIINTLEPVEVVVEKLWIGEFEANGLPRYASADYDCYNVRPDASGPTGSVSGGLNFDGDSTDTIPDLYPDWDGSSYCEVSELHVDNPVEPDDSDCSHVVVTPGVGGSCTIYNTLFLEGIPTLSKQALALLALLMLGVGLVGFRRFS